MFRKLVTLEQAREIIKEQIRPKSLGIEEIRLLEASHRILAEDIKAIKDVPPFDRSTVDGYAVRAEDTFGAEENMPVTMSVHGQISIGKIPKTIIKKNEAAEIVTGAPIPKGADAVVMLEHTHKSNDQIHVYTAVTKAANVMKTGADIRKGETVLKNGRQLGSSEIGILAALGREKVKAHKIPRVAVLSTGPEVIEPGRRLSPGKIYDINAYSLSIAVIESGGKPKYIGIFTDSATKLRKALKQALANSDIVVTSGGVSVGPKDVIPRVLNSLGKPGVILSGIAVKPGKPATVALIRRKPVFSLPGHPTSALLVYHLLVRPVVRLTGGNSESEFPTLKARLVTRIFPSKGRKTFIMVKLKGTSLDKLAAEPLSGGESGAISTLARADGFVEIPENVQFIDAYEEVTVHLLRNYMNSLKQRQELDSVLE